MNTATSQQLNHISVKTAAGFLNTCPNKLFAFLRDHNVLSKENFPCGRYTARGYFLVDIKQVPGKRASLPMALYL